MTSPFPLGALRAVLLLASVVACDGGAPEDSTTHPDVVVLTLDSLRPDHVGSHGGDESLTPNLDRLSEESVRFVRAFSTSSFTPPSHASLFTSKGVGSHGLHRWGALADAEETLAETLRSHGYRTGARVQLELLSKQNLGQGLEWQSEGSFRADEVVAGAIEFLERDDPRPLFLWLHFYDTHRPYGRERRWWQGLSARARAEIGEEKEHYNLTPEDVEAQGLDEGDIEYIDELYDDGVAYLDRELGPLLDLLDRPDRKRRTLFIVTADHAEALREYPERMFTHDPYLRSGVTHIPLLVRFPDGRGAGARVEEAVSLIDLAPTVLAAAGLPLPSGYEGASLLPLVEGAEWHRESILLETWGWARLKALRSRRHAVLYDMEAGTTRYFDVLADPQELDPLPVPDVPEVRAMERALAEIVRSEPADPSGEELDPELLEMLEQLGYLDSPPPGDARN